MSTPTIAAAVSPPAADPGAPALVAPRRRGLPYKVISWTVPVLLLVAWELLARAGVIAPNVLPAPSSVGTTAWRLTETGELPTHLWESLKRAAIGLAIGGSLGLVLGTLTGFSRLGEAIVDRNIQIVRAIPFLAILPLVMVWFGVGESGRYFLVALGTLFPIYLNTVLGIRQVDPKLLEMGRVVGLPKLRLVRTVILPGALPSVLLGVRLALTNAWLALVIAETVGAPAGIGFMATNAREFLQTDVIVLVIVLYALIGLTTDLFARFLERRLLAWHPNYHGGSQ
ncbi:aliphatic sulfonates transporter permease [Actinoplanes sp. NBRC 14428]|uniref:Sulfonate transport system permease protein n=1 Tax=Pseudosporangium ferrugineum TaxID=439699 RepID=A0A2T0RQB0_9ACTN|nr:ABC transporter permease subunit [Pseudosporangium ferrugineum]PRY23341.1 sulfonate transport system permease protein [Pseudosporangium ferrugineum]BCJ55327.1 aliphatic sulfonates transporter permease [Actinoplanes sp. NBRC 14428]